MSVNLVNFQADDTISYNVKYEGSVVTTGYGTIKWE